MRNSPHLALLVCVPTINHDLKQGLKWAHGKHFPPQSRLFTCCHHPISTPNLGHTSMYIYIIYIYINTYTTMWCPSCQPSPKNIWKKKNFFAPPTRLDIHPRVRINSFIPKTPVDRCFFSSPPHPMGNPSKTSQLYNEWWAEIFKPTL